ncbi:MAG TPA: S8 family serine peptidase [Actinomycetota bacterium]|nr:S8 family serine peptidase [Actinomycetota bacterium]
MRGRCGRWAALAAIVTIATSPAVLAAGDPLRSDQYGLDRISLTTALNAARGAGVIIAVLDTGVNLNHEDLRNQLLPGRDFVDDDDHPMDANGHGTHVAGIAAAESGNGLGVEGVAPGAKIMPLRVLDTDGTGVESDVAAAIRHALLQAAQRRMALVINLSLTDMDVQGGSSSRQIRDAIREAWVGGAVVVAAAGNEALPFSDYPAEGPNVISVGATDDRDRRATFSNRGANVVAPGEKVISTFWDAEDPRNNAVYAIGSGTSQAAPHAAGVAALLMSTGLSNERTVDRILRTADDLGPPGPDDEYGFGRLNAARALGTGVAGRPVSDASGIPSVGEGKFEPIATSPSPGPVAAAPVDARSPSRTVPMLLALALLVVAYSAVRVGALGHPSREEAAPVPWSFDPFE